MKLTTLILASTLLIARAPRVNCIESDMTSESDCAADYALVLERSSDRQFILELMDLVKSPLEPKIRLATASLVADVGRAMTLDQRRSWFILLAIESKFSQKATSSSGAVGIGQIVLADPRYIARITGILTTVAGLKKDVHINLLVSAGIYRHFGRKTKSAVLTLVAYNAGLSSSAVANIQKITAINLETANYVAKHSYISEWMSGDRTALENPAALVAGL